MCKNIAFPNSKDPVSMLIRYRSETFASDSYLIDVDLKVFAICVGMVYMWLAQKFYWWTKEWMDLSI